MPDERDVCRASHMLAAGADLAYVSAQLGHANPATTLRIYAHWVPGVRRITPAVLDALNASKMQVEVCGEEMEIQGGCKSFVFMEPAPGLEPGTY